MAQDMPRPSIGTPPVGLVAGGLIAAACGLWLAATTISRVSPPAEEPRAAAGALVARGRTLLEAQRLAAAHDCFAEAVRLDPAAADGHRGLAAVAYDQGSLMQAVTHLEHAAALDPDDGSAAISNAAFSASDSPALSVQAAAEGSSSLSPARDGVSARPATAATWHRPPPTSPIASSRRYRCGSG